MSTHVAQVPLFEPVAEVTAPLVTATTADPEAAAEVRASLQVFGQVGGYGLGEYEWKQALKGIADDVTVIDLDIHSRGGSVFVGFWMGNELRRKAREIGARIETTCYGLAASIASYLFVLGEKRTLALTGFVQAHTAWGRVEGNADIMEYTAGLLRQLDPKIRQAYLSRVSLSDEEMEAAMSALSGRGTWYTAEEALDLGFATDLDDLEPPDVPEEEQDLSGFANAPEEAVARYGHREPQAEKPDDEEALAAEVLAFLHDHPEVPPVHADGADESALLALIEETLQGEG